MAAKARKDKEVSAERRRKRGEHALIHPRETMTPEMIREEKEKLLKERADDKASKRKAKIAKKAARNKEATEKTEEEKLMLKKEKEDYEKAKPIFQANYARYFKTLDGNPDQLEK